MRTTDKGIAGLWMSTWEHERSMYAYAAETLKGKLAARGYDVAPGRFPQMVADIVAAAFERFAGFSDSTRRSVAAGKLARRCLQNAADSIIRRPLGGHDDAMNHCVRDKHGFRHGSDAEVAYGKAAIHWDDMPEDTDRWALVQETIDEHFGDEPKLAAVCEILAAGWNASEAAALLGLTKQAVSARIGQIRRRLSPETPTMTLAIALIQAYADAPPRAEKADYACLRRGVDVETSTPMLMSVRKATHRAYLAEHGLAGYRVRRMGAPHKSTVARAVVRRPGKCYAFCESVAHRDGAYASQ